MNKEQKFFSALRDVFVGAKIEGESGYINLMRVKSKYYTEGVFPRLTKDIDIAVKPFSEKFREELFDRLYDFFHRYFSESGSIYFRYTPLYQNIYEKVYTDDRDMMLFWKTHMLYYVKTDRRFVSTTIEIDGQKYYFDASKVEHKKANEKREIVYSLTELRKDNTIVLAVGYSEKGKITKTEDILKALKKHGNSINEDLLKRAFRLFEKQSEVDFFINQDAKAFLEEQFNLWLYQYVFVGETMWTEIRINQLQAIRTIALNIIAFIGQFENELVKIWNKPKFVINSNYVITLDRIWEKDFKTVEKLIASKSFDKQIAEWKELKIVDGKFKKGSIVRRNSKEHMLNDECRFLPIDTRFFKNIESEILSLFNDLDNSIDGWMIKGDNYQALSTIMRKFKDNIQLIYIDPPFNTGDDFAYVDRFQDSTWLTLMENRLTLAHTMLNKSGTFYLHLDENANFLGRLLMDKIFGKEQFRREIIWDIQVLSGFKVKGADYKWILGHQSIYFYSKTDDYYFKKLMQPQSLKYLESFKQTDEKGLKYQVAHGRRIYQHMVEDKGKPFGDVWANLKDLIDVERPFLDVWKELTAAVDFDAPMRNVWSDIMSFQQQPTSSERLNFDTQKPEKLLERIIKASTKERELVLDFYGGCGTTAATAQKINRKWVTIELGEQFYSQILPRMKRTIGGHQTAVSRDNNYAGGGFFKYFEIESYEEALARTIYADSDLFEDPNNDPYHQYVFLRDIKMLSAVDVEKKGNYVRVSPEKIYPNIDMAETISNLTGNWIKRMTDDKVEFVDGETLELKNVDWKFIKPLIWW